MVAARAAGLSAEGPEGLELECSATQRSAHNRKADAEGLRSRGAGAECWGSEAECSAPQPLSPLATRHHSHSPAHHRSCPDAEPLSPSAPQLLSTGAGGWVRGVLGAKVLGAERLVLRSRGAEALVLLTLMLVGVSGQNTFTGTCNSALSGGISHVTNSSACGLLVTLSGNGSAQAVTVKVAFAINEVLPNSIEVRVNLPTDRGGFQFDVGGTTEVVGLVTPQGSQTTAVLHGTGVPTVTKSGSLAIVKFGGMGTPTLADSQAGYEFELTNVRNPFANEGQPRDNVTVQLVQAGTNGTAWYEQLVTLPEFFANRISSPSTYFELTNPAAGSVTDIQVTVFTTGYIPADGSVEVTFPADYTLSQGSTVAISQRNLGLESALYVESLDPATRTVRLQVAGILGIGPTVMPPLVEGFFRLTRVRNPFAGVTGTFNIKTFSAAGNLIDEGPFIAGVTVTKGALTNVAISSVGEAARQPATYTFIFSTTGTIPGDGKVVVEFPFGFFLMAPVLSSFNGFGDTGVPTLTSSGLVATIQMGGINTSTFLDATDDISITLGGIVNPGAGSTEKFVIKTTYFDAANVIDEAQIAGVGITTGLFPFRSVTISENRAGRQNTVTVAITTEGFIPDDLRIAVVFPAGFGVSTPIPTEVTNSQICEVGINCTDPNITVSKITGQEVVVKLRGDGARNLPTGTNITFTINNIRNLWAGQKDGFDLSLLLSDEISVVMQAKDVDGPVLIAGTFRNVDIQYSETPELYPNTFGVNPIAGRCGMYRVALNVTGILPTDATIKVFFPETIQLNDVSCDIDTRFPDPVSRVSGVRVPNTLSTLETDAGARTFLLSVNGGSSDSWDIPNILEFFVSNVRHTRATTLGGFKVQALLPDKVSVIEESLDVQVLDPVASTSQAVTVTPNSLAAGVRTTVDVSLQIKGRLPLFGFIEVTLPSSFRLSDGDTTAVLQSFRNSTSGNMFVTAIDVSAGTVRVQIEADTGVDDGMNQSTYICQGPDTNCVRTPTDVTTGHLQLEGEVLTFTLSQIRNLAGGYSGDFQVRSYTKDGSGLVEENPSVAGATLVIGALADGTITPAQLGSAIRTTYDVMVSISNTLPTNGNVYIKFPAGFTLNDGGPTNITNAELVLYTSTEATPARVTSANEATGEVLVAIGGSENVFLQAFNLVRFTLVNIRNMVARPSGNSNSQLSGVFVLSTQLSSGAFVENLTVAAVVITPNVIEPVPVGRGDVLPSKFENGSEVSVLVQYSTDSVLPATGVISTDFPNSYEFNVGKNSTFKVTYDGVQDPNYNFEIVVTSLHTNVRAIRFNGTGPVAPQVLVAMNISNVRLSRTIQETKEFNISTLTFDGATIATGALPGTQIGRPSAPTNIVAINCPADWPETDPQCVQVTWAPPLDSAGSPITNYRIEIDRTSSAFADLVQTININLETDPNQQLLVKSITLTEGRTHYVRVRAGNKNGGSLGFGRAGFGDPVRVLSMPGAPRAAILRSDTTNRLFASWLAPQFTGALNPPATITKYKIEYDRNGRTFTDINTNYTVITAGTDRSVVSGLLQPGVYHARVFAGNPVGFGEPTIYQSSALATPVVPVAFDDTVTPLEGSVLLLQVGTETSFTVRAFDGDITDAVELTVDAETGLPVRTAVSPLVLSGQNGGAANVATRVFSMTPFEPQAGLVFDACFTAKNSNADALGQSVDVRRCVKLRIMRPQLSWTSRNETADTTPLEGETFVTYPGCSVDIPLYANAVWYKVIYGYEAFVFEFNGSLTRNGDIPGASISTPHPQPVINANSFVNIPTNYSHSGIFRYFPPVSVAGRRLKVCLTASDEFRLETIQRCVFITTGNCKACLAEGQTLSGLAAEYDTDWLQVWATNPRLGNPNKARTAGTLVNVGVLYHALGGETVTSLATRFFLTATRILDANPEFVERSGGREVATTRALIPNQQLCIIPPMCQVECPGGGSCFSRGQTQNPGFVA